MKICLEYNDGKRIKVGKANNLDEARKVVSTYLKENYSEKIYYHRYWINNENELVDDFGSHSCFIIYTDLTAEDLVKLST